MPPPEAGLPDSPLFFKVSQAGKPLPVGEGGLFTLGTDFRHLECVKNAHTGVRHRSIIYENEHQEAEMKALKMSIIFFLALIIGCDTSTNYGPANLPVEGTISHEGMEYRLTLPKNRYLLTDTISGSYTVTNRTGTVKTFFFANIQQFGFRLTDLHGKTPLFSPAIVSPATSSLELPAGETKEFVLNAVFKDFNGTYINRQEYTLAAYLLDNNSPAAAVSITVE